MDWNPIFYRTIFQHWSSVFLVQLGREPGNNSAIFFFITDRHTSRTDRSITIWFLICPDIATHTKKLVFCIREGELYHLPCRVNASSFFPGWTIPGYVNFCCHMSVPYWYIWYIIAIAINWLDGIEETLIATYFEIPIYETTRTNTECVGYANIPAVIFATRLACYLGTSDRYFRECQVHP